MHERLTKVAAALLVLAAACGDSDEKKTTTAALGLPDTKTLSSLTTEEATSLCKQSDEYFDKHSGVNEWSCRVTTLVFTALSNPTTDADARKACATAYDECIKGVDTTKDNDCSTAKGKIKDTCTATVGEFRACLESTQATFAAATDQFPSCSNVTLKSLAEIDSKDDPNVHGSTACKTLDAKCPGVFDLGDDSDTP